MDKPRLLGWRMGETALARGGLGLALLMGSAWLAACQRSAPEVELDQASWQQSRAALGSAPETLVYELALSDGSRVRDVLLRLRRVAPPLGDGYTSQRLTAVGELLSVPATLPDCFYRGDVALTSEAGVAEAVEGSFVSVNTCLEGAEYPELTSIRGLVQAWGRAWGIQAQSGDADLQDGVTHQLTPVSGGHEITPVPESEIQRASLRRSFSLPDWTEQYLEGTPQETKYIQVVVVNDSARASSVADPEAEAVAVVEQANAILEVSGLQPRVRIVLVGQVTFETDPYQPTPLGQEVVTEDLLQQFRAWGAGEPQLPQHDVRMLFSGYDFDGATAGLAPLGAACDQEGAGLVVQATDQAAPLITVHELGHTLGMDHDGAGNNCQEVGFVMAAVSCSNCPEQVTQFSDCSQQYFDAWLAAQRYALEGRCLDDLPTNPSATLCGDGVVSGDEQCDCGSQDCADVDPCCDGASCQLVADAECSDFNDGCCRDCRVVPAADQVVCREARGECDQEEVCNGLNAQCPGDVFSDAGLVCADSDGNAGSCYLGQCVALATTCVQAGELYDEELQAPSEVCDWSCAELACNADEFTCVHLQGLAAPDGAACGQGMQCVEGQCVADVDQCPQDPDKSNPGQCGCGKPDSDGDMDGTPDCVDGCADDALKTAPGRCGCGKPDADTDTDGTPDCEDQCPEDPNKVEPGVCDCGKPETGDTDTDGAADCIDECPTDPTKILEGDCGCGKPETDGDGDGVSDCVDECPMNASKAMLGQCGCTQADTDGDGDGIADCNDRCPEDVTRVVAPCSVGIETDHNQQVVTPDEGCACRIVGKPSERGGFGGTTGLLAIVALAGWSRRRRVRLLQRGKITP